MAENAASDSGWRPVLPLTRFALLLGSFLVFLAGVQLFLLTTRTEHWFAWTIAVPVTAAFLGAFYWGAIPLALLSGTSKVWAWARVGVPGVAVFLWGTLATTLLHLGKFHFHSPDHVAKGAAYLWTIIYAADPPLVTSGLILQWRVRGQDPPRTAILPLWYRASLAVHAAASLFVGVALFVAPSWAGGWWPWKITPLTARAMASWLLGLGVVLVTAVLENDWVRIRVAAASYTVLGALHLIAVARYAGDLRGGAGTWLYVVFVATALPLGLVGWFRGHAEARKARRSIRGS